MELRKTENSLNKILTSYCILCQNPITNFPTTDVSSDKQTHIPSLLSLEELYQLWIKQHNYTDTITKTIPNEVTLQAILLTLEQLPQTTTNFLTAQSQSPEHCYHTLQSLQTKLQTLQHPLSNIKNRKTHVDPITGTPRYGKLTLKRVEKLILLYEILTFGLVSVFGFGKHKEIIDEEACLAEVLCQLILQNEEEKEEQREELEARSRINQDILQKQTLCQEQAQQKIQQQKKEENKLTHQQQPKIKIGLYSLQTQLSTLQSSTSPPNYTQAIKSIHTIYKQIISHPELPQYRTIRCNHIQFMNDIGQHTGGLEFLLASGFQKRMLEGVECFIMEEPGSDEGDDMDTWMEWYKFMKGIMDILGKELESLKKY